jgi:hypothetical protein
VRYPSFDLTLRAFALLNTYSVKQRHRRCKVKRGRSTQLLVPTDPPFACAKAMLTQEAKVKKSGI